MAVMGMKRINICAMRKDRKALLEKLQFLGTVDPDIDLPEDYEYDRVDVTSSRQLFEKQILRCDQALGILDEYAPIKKAPSIAGRELKASSELKDAETRRSAIADKVSAILDLKRRLDDSKADIIRLITQEETLTPWLALDIPAGMKGTRNTSFIIGTVPAALTEEGIVSCISEKSADIKALSLKTLYTDTDFIYFALICLKKDAETVENALREKGFSRIALTGDKSPAQMKADMESQKQNDEKRIQELAESIASYSDNRTDIMLLHDYYAARAGKYELLGKIPETENTFAISGYVTEEDAERTAELIKKDFKAAVELEDIKEEEQPPVKLKNNKFSENFEGITTSFGLPRKGEVDPTTIMSFFYVFFFGLMLSDAAYGLLVALVTFILVKKFPRMDEGMKKSLKLFLYGGLSTLFWGIMFGGYFGDVVDVVGRVWFGAEIPEGGSLIPAVWFVPLKNPMYLLDWCMLFGVIHLFVGHGIKGYMYLKDKNIKGFIFEVMGWYVLLIGLMAMLL
ncbi:MAG: V-type ATP synthase subunit I, partial [Lachnospiraceae bacterium]|nr:V-type ATP synthase subunit I [Lachnospiraceae bacterium]